MITLNDLLTISDVEQYTVLVPLTTRLKARVTISQHCDAELDDLVRLYGEYPVKRFSPAYKGDERMVIELGMAEK